MIKEQYSFLDFWWLQKKLWLNTFKNHLGVTSIIFVVFIAHGICTYLFINYDFELMQYHLINHTTPFTLTLVNYLKGAGAASLLCGLPLGVFSIYSNNFKEPYLKIKLNDFKILLPINDAKRIDLLKKIKNETNLFEYVSVFNLNFLFIYKGRELGYIFKNIPNPNAIQHKKPDPMMDIFIADKQNISLNSQIFNSNKLKTKLL